jgi:hypothetical protein
MPVYLSPAGTKGSNSERPAPAAAPRQIEVDRSRLPLDEDLEDVLADLASGLLLHSHRHATHDRALQDVLDSCPI